MRTLIWASATLTFGAMLVAMVFLEVGGLSRNNLDAVSSFILLIAFGLVALVLHRFVRASFDEDGNWR